MFSWNLSWSNIGCCNLHSHFIKVKEIKGFSLPHELCLVCSCLCHNLDTGSVGRWSRIIFQPISKLLFVDPLCSLDPAEICSCVDVWIL